MGHCDGELYSHSRQRTVPRQTSTSILSIFQSALLAGPQDGWLGPLLGFLGVLPGAGLSGGTPGSPPETGEEY